MEFRVLTYFLTIVREKSISKAAKTLHISQPALSKQIKQLEEELGIKLFKRGSREIVLSEEGIYLATRGKEILALVDQTTKNITKDAEINGEITIGGGETPSMKDIAKTLHRFTNKYPQVKTQLYSGNADDVLQKLDKGLVDFGLVIDPVEKQKYDYLQLKSKNRWGVLIQSTHPLAKKVAIHPTDLKEIPLYISSQTLVNNQLEEWFGQNLDHFNIIGTYNLLYNASLMVQEGLAAALCLNGIINTNGLNLTFIPLNPYLDVHLNLIWKKNQILSKTAYKFLEYLTEDL